MKPNVADSWKWSIKLINLCPDALSEMKRRDRLSILERQGDISIGFTYIEKEAIILWTTVYQSVW